MVRRKKFATEVNRCRRSQACYSQKRQAGTGERKSVQTGMMCSLRNSSCAATKWYTVNRNAKRDRGTFNAEDVDIVFQVRKSQDTCFAIIAGICCSCRVAREPQRCLNQSLSCLSGRSTRCNRLCIHDANVDVIQGVTESIRCNPGKMDFHHICSAARWYRSR